MSTWRERVLERLKPTPEEDRKVRQDARELRDAVQELLDSEGWPGEPRVEGSVAKGTYLHGQADADVFVAFPGDVPRSELSERVHAFGGLLDDAVIAYAEHPYVRGRWKGHPAEIVPCYGVSDASELRSAVDRTRLHTDHVNRHLAEHQRDEVRLLKAFLYGAEAYGAEESVLGFSGYLAELLVLAFQDLEGVLAWAAGGFEHPVVLEEPGSQAFEEPLVVVDPVDPERNVAAAVSRRTLVRVREAAAAFRCAPEEEMFAHTAPREPGLDELEARLAARGTRVLAIGAPTPGAELVDPVHAQARRAAHLAAERLEHDQVPVRATAIQTLTVEDQESPKAAWGLIEADARALERPILHHGPPVRAGEHADRFRERWTDAPDAAGPVEEVDGRLLVQRRREDTDLVSIVRRQLARANAGKVFDAAMEDGSLQLLEGKQALQAAPGRALARLLDRRRPWERA